VTCANIRFRELVLNPRDAPQTHAWGASLLSEPRRRGRWFSGVARRRSGAVAEEVAEEVAERPSAPARNGRRGDQAATPLEIVDIVHNSPGGSLLGLLGDAEVLNKLHIVPLELGGAAGSGEQVG